jgi:hypothetical protein
MTTAVAQTPTDTASVTAQITSHIMLNPPNCTVARDRRAMMFKICRQPAEMSPVHSFPDTYLVTLIRFQVIQRLSIIAFATDHAAMA